MPRFAAALGVIVGPVAPGVVGVGRIPVTCLLLVFCLVPVRVIKILVNTLWFIQHPVL